MKKKKTLGTIKREQCKRLNFNPRIVRNVTLTQRPGVRAKPGGTPKVFTLTIRYGKLLTPFSTKDSSISFRKYSSAVQLAKNLRDLADTIDGTTQRKNDSQSG